MEKDALGFENRLESLEAQQRAMFARVLAQDTIVQTLLAVVLTLPGEVTAPFMRILRSEVTPSAVLSEEAAEWWSDVEVKRREILESMIAKADQQLRDLPKE